MRIGRRQQIRGGIAAAGDQHARDLVCEHGAEHGHARVVIETLEIADLALAEDQHSRRAEILVETRERQTCLLDVWAGDRPIETATPAQELERKTDGIGSALEQPLHRQGRS